MGSKIDFFLYKNRFYIKIRQAGYNTMSNQYESKAQDSKDNKN